MHAPCAPLESLVVQSFRSSAFGAFIAFVAFAGTTLAAGAPTYDDYRLSLQARQAVLGDSALEPFSLGVSVKRRIAMVWGAVPDKKLAERALDRIRKVPGIAEVIDRIAIEDPLPSPIPSREWPRPPAPPEPNAPSPPPETPRLQAPRPNYAAPPAAPKSGSTVKLPNASVPATWSPASRYEGNPAKAGTPSSKSPPAFADVARVVAELCRASVRYRYVRTDVTDGVVRLRGSVVRGEDLFTLAQAIGRLPGVTRVVVEADINPLLQIGPE